MALGLGAGCGSVSTANDSDGSAGVGGAGGGSGGAGGGGTSCTDLENQYSAALTAARSCNVAAAGACQQLASSSLSPCFDCMTYVNDASALDAIKMTWKQAGCDSSVGMACPAIACLQPTTGVCVASDGGGGTCSSQNSLPPPPGN